MKTFIGYDHGTPQGDKSVMIIGHSDRKGRMVVDEILEGAKAQRMAILHETRLKALRNIAHRNADNELLRRVKRERAKLQKQAL